MRSFWLRPSATYRYFCLASFENATSHVEPSPSESGATKISLTNLPSRALTCSRSLVPIADAPRPAAPRAAATPAAVVSTPLRPRPLGRRRLQPRGRDPDVALGVDHEAARRLRPLIALARAAEIRGSLPSESNCSTNGAATQQTLDVGGFAICLFVPFQRVRAAMGDPDAVPGVDSDAGHRAEDPMVRQWLRPQRHHLERRRRRAAALRHHAAARRGEPRRRGPASKARVSLQPPEIDGSIQRGGRKLVRW